MEPCVSNVSSPASQGGTWKRLDSPRWRRRGAMDWIFDPFEGRWTRRGGWSLGGREGREGEGRNKRINGGACLSPWTVFFL